MRGEFSQLCLAGGEESAEPAIGGRPLCELLEPGVPALHGAADKHQGEKEKGKKPKRRRWSISHQGKKQFAVLEEPAGVIDQGEIVFPRGNLPAFLHETISNPAGVDLRLGKAR